MTENELHALVDGRLATSRRAEVEAWLQTRPEAAAQVEAWRSQRVLLDRLDIEVMDEPVPARLVAALDAWPRHGPASAPARDHARRGRDASLAERLSGWWPRPRVLAGACAMALVGWLAGWMSHAGWSEHAAVVAAPGFVGEARRAHVVYVPEVRHPVEVEAAQQEHLVQWLSKRLGRPLKVPQLQDEGFALLGGRLLPVTGAVGAQFMYQGGDGQRLTLHVAALDHPAPDSETAFRIVEDGGTASFYWIDRGFGYTVTGKLPRERMLAVAKAVYEQTNE